MSISTEIERLNASKSAIAQAIRNKGVDVPEDAKIDTFAQYIATLGSLTGTAKIFTGTNRIVCTSTISGRPFAGFKIYGKSTQNGIPSHENPVPIVNSYSNAYTPILVTGKNLFYIGKSNISNTVNGVSITYDGDSQKFSIKGTSTANYFLVLEADISSSPLNYILKQGFTYTYSNNLPSGTYSQITYRDTKDEVKVLLYSYSTTPTNFELPTDFKSISSFHVGIANKDYSFDSKDITFQIELGNFKSDFNPHYNQSFSVYLPNGFPGIKVDSGGNYKDVSGQQWICNYRDYSAGIDMIATAEISSYNGEEITTPYISSTGDLTIGAQVIYALPEAYTQPIPDDDIYAYGLNTSMDKITLFFAADDVSGMEATVYCNA